MKEWNLHESQISSKTSVHLSQGALCRSWGRTEFPLIYFHLGSCSSRYKTKKKNVLNSFIALVLYPKIMWSEKAVGGSLWITPFNSLLSLSYSLVKVKPVRPHCWLQGFTDDRRRHRMVEAALNFVWQLGVFEGIKPIWGFLQLLAAWSVTWEKYLSRNKHFLTESMPQKRESWFWRISED